MPAESRYEISQRRIYLRFWGDLTLQEFQNSLKEEQNFFRHCNGHVVIIIDAQHLKTLPFSIVDVARNMHLAQYKPLSIGLIGTNAFMWSMVSVFQRLTGIRFKNFNSTAEAEAYFKVP